VHNLDRAIDEFDQRVDDALMVDHHVDLLERQPEQPVGFDDLEALVHERGRVDGDLRAHRPARVVQRLLDRDPIEVQVGVGPERPARRRDDEAAHVLALLAPQALPDGAVLGIHGPDPMFAGGSHDQVSGHDQHLFGRQRNDLARFQRGQRRRQGSSAGDGDDHDIAPRVGDHLGDPVVEVSLPRLALDQVVRSALGGPAALRQTEQAEAVRIAVDDIERLLADRARGAEDGDVDCAP